MKNRTTRRICLTALMAAIIYVFTAYIHVPSHTGYTHVGDGFLYLAASILPALVLCVGGYYLYEALITGNFTAPALGIPGYLTQVALSSIVYLALGSALDRTGIKKKLGEI